MDNFDQFSEDVKITFQKDILTKQDSVFEKALRKNAVPPIRGEITSGKVKWRGIKIATIKEPFKITTYLSQRGKQISDKIVIDWKDCKFKFQ